MVLPLANLPTAWAFQLLGFDVALRLDTMLFLVAGVVFGFMVAARRTPQEIRLYNPMEFADLGFKMIGCKTRGTSKARARRFKAHFGCDPAAMSALWHELYKSGWLRYAGVRPKPEHLLFALVFLKSYASEEIHAALCKTNVRTFRRWSWFYAEGIANLDKKFVSCCVFVCLFGC